jgi:hypothetical protein
MELFILGFVIGLLVGICGTILYIFKDWTGWGGWA